MARPHPDLLAIARGTWITGDVVPEGLVASALDHRFQGLLGSQVDRDAVDCLPDADLRLLAVKDLEVQAHHDRLWRVLCKVYEILSPVGVELTAIKGVTTEARWYDRIGERPCEDVDLFLAPSDLPALRDVLLELGLGSERVELVVRLVRRRALQHVSLSLDGVAVDLHFDPLKLGIWTRGAQQMADAAVTTVSPSGQPIRTLSAEHALVSFLTHLNKDRFAFLGAFVDVARITARESLDWDMFDEFVRGEGLEVPVYRSLAAVDRVLDLPDMPSYPVGGKRGALWDRLWPPGMQLQGYNGRLSHPHRQTMIPLLARGRSRDCFAEWRRQVLPDKGLLALQARSPSTHSYLRRVSVDRVTQAKSRRRQRTASDS